MPNYRRVFIENSFLFLTLTTYERNHILIKNIDLLRESFKRAKSTYNFQIYASVVLPDHMHLILSLENIKEYPKIIFAIKYHFSKNINLEKRNISESKIKKGEKGVWQRRYYEHTIRNEKDLNNHLDYTHFNPIKHGYVLNVRDWKYSSFHKFVEHKYYEINWGNFEEIKEIQKMNLE